MIHASLTCLKCNHHKAFNGETLSLLSQKAKVDPSQIDEKFLDEWLPKFKCSKCQSKEVRLTFQHESSELLEGSEVVKACETCGQPIPVERLQAVPNVARCVKCQEKAENWAPEPVKPILCEKCGSPMVWRLTRNVHPAKYFLGCSAYPKCTFIGHSAFKRF